MSEKKTVFMSIGADVIHGGHMEIIHQAAGLGELTVGVLTDEVVASFVTTELTALKSPVSNDRLDPLQQSAAEALKGATALVGAVQDTISSEARSSLFANIQYVVTGKMTAREAVATAMALNES